MAKKKVEARNTPMEKQRQMLCDNLSFAGSEAYKQLRTNILFSLPKKDGCKIIAVTSATPGDGKSTTSINLAHSLAATGLNVLLVEGDMRLPYMAQRLEIKTSPGLSDLLVGSAKASEVIQNVDTNNPFSAITAGSLPPNPSELLSSDRMKDCLKAFGTSFDYVILDLPPVNVVTDAASLSNEIDGYVLVVRQNVTTMRSVEDAVEKLGIVNAKILGFVLNDVHSSDRGYYKGKNSYSYGQ